MMFDRCRTKSVWTPTDSPLANSSSVSTSSWGVAGVSSPTSSRVTGTGSPFSSRATKSPQSFSSWRCSLSSAGGSWSSKTSWARRYFPSSCRINSGRVVNFRMNASSYSSSSMMT